MTESSGFGKELGKGMGIAIADFNGDGYMDVFVANDTVRNFLFINQKNGTFKESGYEWGVAYDESGNAGSSMGADAKDYDNDGWPDLFYNNLKGQIWGLYRNMGGKFMNYVSGVSRVSRLSARSSGWSNGFVDYNNDGWKDLYSSNGDIDNMGEISRQHDTMFENVDGKEFRDVSASLGADFSHAGFQRGSAFVDLNNDGFPDLVVTSLDEKPRILLNSADNGNHWLLVEYDWPPQQSRWHRRRAEADHRVRPHALQSRDHFRRLHVVERQAGTLRAGGGEGHRRWRSAGPAALCRR